MSEVSADPSPDDNPRRVHDVAYRAAHPDRVKAARDKWRAANHEAELASGRERARAKRAADPEPMRQKSRAWRAANIDRERARKRAHRTAHRDQINARERAWRAANPEKARAKSRKHNEKRREEKRLYAAKKRRTLGPAALSEINKAGLPRKLEWERRDRKKNLAKYIDRNQRRRALKEASPLVEVIDRAAIIARDRSTCYLCSTVVCGRRITLDHVVPLTRGGAHCASNLRVACRSCNSRKYNLTLDEYRARYHGSPL